MLRHLGFQAGSVKNGRDALKALKEKPYTFLLTDIKMPGMNGLELIQRTRDEYPQVPTVTMTGYYNQRHFYTRLREEVLRAERQKHPLALIFLDLDNFKKYNDTHGHFR